MTKGKLESSQPKMPNCSTDLSFGSANEFMELLWENGQLIMQGTSSRARKSSLMTTFPSRDPKFQEKDNGDVVIPDMGRKNGKQASVLNDFSSSGHVGLEHDDDMVPWLNYHIDDSLQNDYCSEFFAELSGASMNPPLVARKNNGLVNNRSSSFGQVVRDSHEFSTKGNLNLGHGNTAKFVEGSSEPIRFRSSQSFPSLQQWRPSSTKEKSKVTDLVTDSNNTASHQSHLGNWSQIPISASEILDRKMQKKDSPSAKPLQPNSSTGLMNFPHFSRPVALVKANLQNIGAAAAGSSAVDNLRSDDKAFITGSSPMEASVVESTSGLNSAAGVSKVDLESSYKPLPEPVSVNQSEAICHQDTLMNNNNKSSDFQCQSSSAAASVTLDRREGEKAFVSALASSSVCSGNSDPKLWMKRKNADAEQSDFQSEDVEDESVDVKKTTKGPKRSRAAEVHNLSERRRRDRINEKMRALQELIPNCNKVDKASMLDEAIEYLKTLQLQIQIMSIGSGLCLPPMMLPAGMQQIRTPHMAHFSPMGAGMGMGMGMGYGMGMIDMGCSSGYPLIPVPSMHGPRFPCSPIPGAPNLLGMPGSSLQMFGMPGQGLPLSLPRAPYIPLPGLSTAAVSAPDPVMASCSIPGPDPSLPSSSKGHIQGINSQSMSKMSNGCSQIQTSMQAVIEGCCPNPHDPRTRCHGFEFGTGYSFVSLHTRMKPIHHRRRGSLERHCTNQELRLW